MQILFSVIFAACLVLAQVCWKLAVGSHEELFAGDISLKKVALFSISPLFILGIILYAFATGLYLYLLSRYRFSTIQAVAIPLSLLFSIGIATLFFGDRLTLVNGIGLLLIGLGIILVVSR